MQIRTLVATSAVALIVSSGALLAQETMSDGLVMVNVAGSMVEVPVALAAQACGMDAAAVIEAADMANTDAKGADMVAAEPDTAGADATTAEATAEEGAAAGATTEAAVGTDAGSTETGTGDVAEGSTDTADAGLTAETATGTEPSGDTATADAGATAGGDAAMPTAVCEIDQATADQHGITAAAGTSGG